MKNIAIILGHPSGKEATFCAALARAYEKGARESGHNVSFIAISGMDIPYLTEKNDYHDPGLPPDLKIAQNKLKSAEHWVIIYPLWDEALPAKLKAFFEWVMAPGFAYNEENQKNPASQKLLKGKSAHIILTMGMPGWFYRWVCGAHSLKAFEKNVLKFCGIKPIRKTIFGFIEAVSDKKRRKWLEQMENFGKFGV